MLLPWAGSLPASPLSGCAEHFIDGEEANAPTLFDSAPTEPFDSNHHLCYQVEDTSFFAMEYWPERFAPRWTAYRLSPEPFGPGECNTYTRAMGNCYINDDEWTEPFECDRGSDPFHSDHLVEGETLDDGAFVNSGHDRGHIAPRQALSWHVCGAYQTFSMANMSPQNAALNQGIWGDLEHQVLTWAIDHGPLHVVSGTTYRFFPHWRFSVYRDGALDPDQIYPPGSTLEDVAEQMSANAEAFPGDHILNPLRTPNPDRLDAERRSLPVPTGYFKVIYRPATGETPAQAIGFLLPHSYERLDRLADHYDGLDRDEAYWGFVSRIEVIEAFSGIRFPGISHELKSEWRSPWFFERRGVRTIRSEDCGDGTPAGVLVGAPRDERRAACRPIPAEPD
ncbi:MAG: DNA/RNA non-specific endonuclease [Xanthomonadales bacterium]|nr:DNA/RNA non-specific endonuclease [Xanthomonadales bacterium]